ncbi:MFS transporter [Penicillium cinerascens]|uniref:MFS transporter n=1 Tax=Penicillium cinerascens TaxID=70096 RepID=A0A9W9TDX7_9EURO|nr:MFS transporter [Penicillium cinerascens]KAJ5219302.1 MFS transporter [Penicillium cinerascens]
MSLGKCPDIEESPANAKAGQTKPIRLSPSGDPLYPAVTRDPMDPLNWNFVQKYTCIVIACFAYCLLTYFTTAPVPSFTELEVQFDTTYTKVNWSFAVPCLGLAIGPLVTSSLAETYGRRIVLIASTAIALVASGCTSLKGNSLSGYMAARFFQGVGAGPSANIGLTVINDLSFEHERGFRVGLWAMSANVGTVLGAVVGGFLASVSQYWISYHVTILFGILLVCECLFLPETRYPRAVVLEHEAGLEGQEMCKETMYDVISDIKRTKQLGHLHFRPIPGVSHPKFWDAVLEFCKLWTYPTISISVCCYVFFQYWWICSIMTMEPLAYETRTVQVQGLLFIGLLVGLVFAEVFCSGRLSDWLVTRLACKNDSQRIPEMRLWLGYPAALVSSVGLILWGNSVDRNWHWMTGQVAFFLYAAGTQVGNTVLSTYVVDNYPEYAMQVIMFYSVVINLSAFINPWFISLWVEESGWTWTFSAQAIICSLGLIPAYALLHRYGSHMRKPLQLVAVS